MNECISWRGKQRERSCPRIDYDGVESCYCSPLLYFILKELKINTIKRSNKWPKRPQRAPYTRAAVALTFSGMLWFNRRHFRLPKAAAQPLCHEIEPFLGAITPSLFFKCVWGSINRVISFIKTRDFFPVRYVEACKIIYLREARPACSTRRRKKINTNRKRDWNRDRKKSY